MSTVPVGILDELGVEGIQAGTKDREGWLISLRWLAISGVAATVGVAIFAGWAEERWALFLVVLAMAAYNQAFAVVHARRRAASSVASSSTLMLQILVDLGALTVLLHLSGGAENPFWVFFVFHMTIAAMLLQLREVVVLAGAAIIMHGGSVVAEHYGILPHHHLLSAAASTRLPEFGPNSGFPALLVGHLFAFVAMVVGSVFFVHSVESDRRKAEAAARAKDQALATSQRMARIGELSAGVAHTIRNPLHGVSNCIDLLRGELGGGDESSRELLELVDDGLGRIERVTRRLLALTRDPELLAVDADLGEVLEDALELAVRAASEAGIEVTSHLQPGMIVRLDPDRFTEAILNLVDNAVAASQPGGHVEVGIELAGPRHVRLWVRDDGSGMSPEVQQQAFRPFFTTKEIGKGTGLGLAITRGVIESLGGQIELESTPGVGTCFTITLPRSSFNE